MHIDIVHTKMQETGYAREDEGVNNIRAHHDLRLKTVKQQKHHHDNAAGTDGSDANQKSSHQTNDAHPDERFHSRRAYCDVVLDFFLKEQESGNANQQNSDRNGDEVIYSITINVSQMNQETDT